MNIQSVKWTKLRAPRKVLAIRLQAMGDLVITLPYLQALRNTLPADTRLDLLTRQEVCAIPKNMQLFNRVYAIGGGRNTKRQLLSAAALIPKLLVNRYEVVIDLQDNIVSRLVTKCLMPESWSLFDRLSEIAAGDRTQLTIEAIGLGICSPAFRFTLTNKPDAVRLLKENGWKEDCPLMILNPAGAFETRNWPMENYVQFAKRMLGRFPETRFVVLGTGFIAAKAVYLKNELGDRCINLIGKTSAAQAFAIIQQVQFMLSEDSGLMHMAWVSGIPTMALFGSTRSTKARPLGHRSDFVDSADLECGGCMLEKCKYGDTHCLTRYTAETIYQRSMLLLESLQTSAILVMK